MINLDKHDITGNQSVAICVKNNKVTYFDSFSVKNIAKRLKVKCNKKIIANIYRIQAHDSMSAYFYIRFINFMLHNKSLIDFTVFFSPDHFKENDKKMVKCFK